MPSVYSPPFVGERIVFFCTKIVLRIIDEIIKTKVALRNIKRSFIENKLKILINRFSKRVKY